MRVSLRPDREGTCHARRRPASGASRVIVALAAALPALGQAPVHAQLPELPTLADAGLDYISGSGFLQITLSGQLDLEALHVADSWVGLVNYERGDTPTPDNQRSCADCHVGMAYQGDGGTIGAHRLRLFADVFLGDHLYTLLEVRSDRGPAPSDGSAEIRIEQAFASLSTATGSFGVQAGRFASPFGSYPLRHLSEEDPFLRPPIAYDYRTVMSRTLVPVDAAIVLDWVEAPQFLRKPGTPPVWDVPYQWGAMLFGGAGPVDVRVAAMNSAPSSAPSAWAFDWDRFERPSWVASARVRATPALEVGASYNRGPWMEEIVAGVIQPEPGATTARPWRDYDQELVSFDVRYARGAAVFLAEAMLDRWEVPNVGERPTERIYSAELQWDLAAGLVAAVRGGWVDFRPLSDELGDASPRPGGGADWDHDVTRYEAAVAYRLSRNLGASLSAFRQRQREGVDADSDFVGLRLWWAF